MEKQNKKKRVWDEKMFSLQFGARAHMKKVAWNPQEEVTTQKYPNEIKFPAEVIISPIRYNYNCCNKAVNFSPSLFCINSNL